MKIVSFLTLKRIFILDIILKVWNVIVLRMFVTISLSSMILNFDKPIIKITNHPCHIDASFKSWATTFLLGYNYLFFFEDLESLVYRWYDEITTLLYAVRSKVLLNFTKAYIIVLTSP